MMISAVAPSPINLLTTGSFMDKEEGREFILDESAQQLYRQLDGLDDTIRVDQSLQLESELLNFLQQEEKKRDNYRLLLAQAASLFADVLTTGNATGTVQGLATKSRALLKVLKNISELAGRESRIYCRFRGQQAIRANEEEAASANPEACDYELAIGDVLLDYQVAEKVAEREPVRGKDLGAKLHRTFTILNNQQIFNFAIEVRSGAELENPGPYERALATLVNFHTPGKRDATPLVRDEYGLPNLNLTMLAAASKVRPATLQQMVDIIQPKLLGPEPSSRLERFTTAYEVILATRIYHKLLKKAPIEINNVHQLMLESRTNRKRTREAVQVSRLVLAKYGDDPRKVAELIASISQEGYRQVRHKVMGHRLSQASEFLNLAEENANCALLQNEALTNIEAGLHNLPDEAYDEIHIEGDWVSAVDAQGRQTSWSLHRKLSQLVSYFKQRAATRRKVLAITNHEVEFDAVDYSVIAKNCGITDSEARILVGLLKECFSDQGRFRRASFEKNIPEFLRYEENVFEFLWYYMKELGSKDDRIAFLNSIQLLVGQLKKPEKALQILLADIFSPASLGRFSDRNGLILAIILLRTYNKEQGSNIELTPEEVLLVRAGLNQEMLKVGLDFFRHHQEAVVQKIKRLTEMLLQVSVQKAHQEEQMQLRFLVSLMREVVMFCALIGGRLSKSTIKGVVREFGNPTSSFYRKADDPAQISRGLKLLQVAARGLKRFNDPFAADLLLDITHREQEFVRLNAHPSHQDTVKKVLEQIGSPEG